MAHACTLRLPCETPSGEGGGVRCFLLVEGMALVKQASPELCGCQTHVKERSISLTCVRPLIDEAGEGEGLSLFQMVLPQRLSPPAAAALHATETQ